MNRHNNELLKIYLSEENEKIKRAFMLCDTYYQLPIYSVSKSCKAPQRDTTVCTVVKLVPTKYINKTHHNTFDNTHIHYSVNVLY